MFTVICALLAGMILALVVLSYRTPIPPLRGSALHPYNIFGFFVFIALLDFGFAYGQVVIGGDAAVFANHSIVVEDELVSGIAYFAFCIAAALAGITLGTMLGVRPPAPPPGWMPYGYGDPAIPGDFGSTAPARPQSGFRHPRTPDNEQAVARSAAAYTMMFTGILGLIVVMTVIAQSLQAGSILYVAGIRQVFFRDNPALVMMYSLLIPSFFLYGSYSRKLGLRLVIIGLGIATMLALLGGRGAPLQIIMALAFWLVLSGRTIPFLVIYLVTPVLGVFLLVLRFLARESDQYANIDAFLQQSGGAISVFFNTVEISMAEAITVNLIHPIMERGIFDSIIGVLVAPIPRALIPWKPMGPSAEFSMLTDPYRWDIVKSEWLITGFTNLYFDLGVIGAVIACGVLGFAWAFAFTRKSVAEPQVLRFWGPVLIVMMYIFFRADLYNLGLFLWPLVAVILMHWGFRQVVRIRLLPAFRLPAEGYGR